MRKRPPLALEGKERQSTTHGGVDLAAVPLEERTIGTPALALQVSRSVEIQPCHHRTPQLPKVARNPSPGPRVDLNNCHGSRPNLLPNSFQIQPQMGMLNPQVPVPFNNPNGQLQQPNGTPTAPTTQQVHPNCQGNPPKLFENSPQMQPQMGMPISQIPILFNNSTTPVINGCGMPMLIQPQSGFMTAVNANQPLNHFFVNNLPMYFNQNVGFPMQNMNQFVQRPLSNYNQMEPSNTPAFSNQVPQVLGYQNPTFIPNPQFGMMSTNSQNQSNSVHEAAKIVQGNNIAQPVFQSLPQHVQQDFCPPASKKSQGNFMNNNGINSPHARWKNNQNNNFMKNSKRFLKNNKQNGKGTFRSHNKHEVKAGHESASSPNKPRRNLSWSYTAEEILQWRVERKKNYPSKANMEKKQRGNVTEPEVDNRVAKLRRQQMKEILEKQAELGCEVAEIPSHYLSDSEKHANGRKGNKKPLGKMGKFQNNKFNKRARSYQNDRSQKKQKFADSDSTNVQGPKIHLPMNKREPTLLQKLLSADIRRDKSRLLQVFRFMVMNSFFKEWPQKPLRFPLVTVKDMGAESEVAVEGLNDFDDDGDGDHGGNDHGRNRIYEVDVKAAAGVDKEDAEEEEGEIID